MEIVLKSGDLTRLFSDSMETRGTIYVTGVSEGDEALKKVRALHNLSLITFVSSVGIGNREKAQSDHSCQGK